MAALPKRILKETERLTLEPYVVADRPSNLLLQDSRLMEDNTLLTAIIFDQCAWYQRYPTPREPPLLRRDYRRPRLLTIPRYI